MESEETMLAIIIHRTALVLTVIAALSAGCAERGAKQMATVPKTGTSAHRAVVMFRAAVDLDGRAGRHHSPPSTARHF
jgi:hypothetical protein